MLPGYDLAIVNALKRGGSERATLGVLAPHADGKCPSLATSLPTSTSTHHAFQTFANDSLPSFASGQYSVYQACTNLEPNFSSLWNGELISAWRSPDANDVASPLFAIHGSFDPHLESPLGLASFSGSPTGWDEELPALDFDHDNDVSLFSTLPGNATAGPSSERLEGTDVPGISSIPRPGASAALPTLLPDSSTLKTRPSRSTIVHTGFKGPRTALLPVDAPVQARSYSAPSVTSRKSDKMSVLDRKRLQNTISARKSRARKQERLDHLEEENDVLRAECERLKKLVLELGGHP